MGNDNDMDVLVDDGKVTAAKVRARDAVLEKEVSVRWMRKAGLQAIVTVTGHAAAADAVQADNRVLIGQCGGFYLIGQLEDEGRKVKR